MKSGELQMNLRKKRNQSSYQHEDHYNSLQEYDEVTKGTARKEAPSRTNDHGNIAKLLVDFINQINSNCRQNKRISKDKERRNAHAEEKVTPQPRKKAKVEQNSDSCSGPTKKQAARDSDDKHEKDKKISKELYRFKDQQAVNLKGLIPDGRGGAHASGKQQLLADQLGVQQIPANIMALMNQNFFTNNEFMNLAQLHNLGLPNINNLNLNVLMQHQFGQRLPSYVCPPEAMRMSAQEQAHQAAQKKVERSSDTKLFRRAAFHVAIAYHIYLKKIQDKDKNHDSVELDPTYYAKKLRQKNNEALSAAKEQKATPAGEQSQPVPESHKPQEIPASEVPSESVQTEQQKPESIGVENDKAQQPVAAESAANPS